MEKKQDPKKELLSKYAKYSGLGIQMGVTIYLGYLGGGWLDEKYNIQEGWGTKGLTLLAVILSTYLIIKEAIKDSN